MGSSFFSLFIFSFLTLTAQAEILKCELAAEPFVQMNYDSTTGEITITDFDTTEKIIAKMSGVSLRTQANGQFALFSSDEKILMTATQDNKGSDERTNLIFPYSVEAHIDAQIQGKGACESSLLPAQKPENSEVEL